MAGNQESQKGEEPIFKVDINIEVPTLPDIPEEQIDIRYPVLPPYAFIHLYWEKETSELIYSVEEPELVEEEKRNLLLLEEGISELINLSYIGIKSQKETILYLEKNLRVLIDELSLKMTNESFLKIMYYIYRDFIGLNEIEPLMQDYFIEDIECNGVDSPVYVVHRKYRNLRTNIMYRGLDKLTSFVEKLAQKAGKYISYANPLLDGRLPDGSRVNSTYTQDISSKGPTFTIRRFSKVPWTPIKLIESGSASPELLAYLWMAIEYERNMMIIGGTGTGKTSFLNSISFFIPPQARIVSIEDTKELNLLHENWLPSVAREGIGLANILGQRHGEVSLFLLLKESFRQRPDYVIVGEVRGEEAYVLFQGMSSGHPSLGTMHAENIETFIRRLETPPINLSPSLVNSLDILCILTQKKIREKEVRRVEEIVEVLHVSDQVGQATTNTPFKWDPATDKFFFKTNSGVLRRISVTHGISMEKMLKEFQLRIMVLIAMHKKRIIEAREVQDIINLYYKNQRKALQLLNITN